MAEDRIQQRLEQYKKLNADIGRLEAALVQVKKMKSDVAKALLDENGKEQVYDLGDGVDVFVSGTRAGTWFLAPRKRGTRRKKPKKEIRDGRVVDVPSEDGADPAPQETAPEEPNRIEAEATLKAASSAETAIPGQPEKPPVEEEAIPAPEKDVSVAEKLEDEALAAAAEEVAEGLENGPESVPEEPEPEPVSEPEPAPTEPEASPEPKSEPEPERELDPLEKALAELEEQS
jgi:hypothetical protein